MYRCSLLRNPQTAAEKEPQASFLGDLQSSLSIKDWLQVPTIPGLRFFGENSVLIPPIDGFNLFGECFQALVCSKSENVAFLLNESYKSRPLKKESAVLEFISCMKNAIFWFSVECTSQLQTPQLQNLNISQMISDCLWPLPAL